MSCVEDLPQGKKTWRWIIKYPPKEVVNRIEKGDEKSRNFWGIPLKK
jgi:hypothetical protein